MKKITFMLWPLLAATLSCSTPVYSQDPGELRIDPLMMVLLKECRSIATHLGDELFPGWEFQKTPVLFYRPNVQELLIHYPHKPKGFALYTGFSPLDEDTIYIRTDTTLIQYDDQNTSTDIEGVRVLVVADPFSTMRNQLQDIIGRPKEFAGDWLKNWNFVPDPYARLQMILHEGFHVYQDRMAPDKEPDEGVVAQYPLLDPENNALYAMEGSILKDALLASDSLRLEKTKEFVAVRTYRQSRLDSSCVEYENLNEYLEGLAKYVEYKFLRAGESLRPTKEMVYVVGFNGYRGILRKKMRNALENMVNIVAVNDDRFGNKFGSGPLRFRLYDLGACQALLLDYTMPRWKEKIFQPNVYLADLLRESLAMTPGELQQYLAEARAEYHYDEAYRNKVEFEKEGKQRIEEKVASILKTDKTLVKVSYAGSSTDALVARYTPFGVTQVGRNSAIYEMIPPLIIFKKGVMLDFKQSIPVLVDREKRQIIFSVSTPPSKLVVDPPNRLIIDELSLTAPMEIERNGKEVLIKVK